MALFQIQLIWISKGLKLYYFKMFLKNKKRNNKRKSNKKDNKVKKMLRNKDNKVIINSS